MEACKAGWYRLAEALLAHGAVQGSVYYMGEAAQNGHVDVVGLLVKETRAPTATTFTDHDMAQLVRSFVAHSPPSFAVERFGKFYAAVKLVVDGETAARDETGCWQLVDAVLSTRATKNHVRMPAAILGFLLRRIHALRDPEATVRSSVSAMMPDTLEAETEAEAEDALRFAITLGRFGWP